MSDGTIRCHYDVLGIERNADAATIKKSHRKLALKLHPDKNIDDESAAEQFRLVQQAYECLSDPAERKWYDEHREAILKGWTHTSEGDLDILFDVVPFMYAGCYRGYDDDEGGFFHVYGEVFQKIAEGEEQGRSYEDENDTTPTKKLPQDFGLSDAPWEDVASFYQGWESFTSSLSFAWADQYDAKEAPNRRVRRAMDDENRKARRGARRARNDDILALVRFVKRRDPRIQARKKEMEEEKAAREKQLRAEADQRKKEARIAREQWRKEAEEEMAAVEEEDRLAGRIRLADLEDDYDYSQGKKGKGKKGKRKNEPADSDEDEGEEQTEIDQVDDEQEANSEVAATEDLTSEEKEYTVTVEAESESEESAEPDIWRCECCRKDFKSEGQMNNHMKSKKHKESYKKYQARVAKLEDELLEEILDEEV